LPISAGVFGIARTIRSKRVHRAISAIRVPAAIDSSVASLDASGGASASHAARICCGFTASTTRLAPSTASRVGASYVWTPAKRASSRARCSASGSTTRRSVTFAPRATRPPASAVAMLPPPMKSVITRSSPAP
jgi:hypothetical protein